MSTLTAIFRIIRGFNCLLAAFSVWVGAYLTTGYHHSPQLVAAMLATFCIAAGGNVVNDLLDIESDRVSHPGRILVRGGLSQTFAIRLAAILHLLAILFILQTNFLVATVALTSLLLLLAYNLWFKRVPLLGNMVVALLGGVTFLCGGFSTDTAQALQLPGPLIPSAFAFFFHLIREIVKDAQDIDGDTHAGLRTLPVLIGVRQSLQVVLLLFVLLAGFTLVPVMTGWYGGWYELVVIGLIDLPLLVILSMTRYHTTPQTIRLSSVALKAGMMLGLAALMLA